MKYARVAGRWEVSEAGQVLGTIGERYLPAKRQAGRGWSASFGARVYVLADGRTFPTRKAAAEALKVGGSIAE